jgi:hypothetical protein
VLCCVRCVVLAVCVRCLCGCAACAVCVVCCVCGVRVLCAVCAVCAVCVVVGCAVRWAVLCCARVGVCCAVVGVCWAVLWWGVVPGRNSCSKWGGVQLSHGLRIVSKGVSLRFKRGTPPHKRYSHRVFRLEGRRPQLKASHKVSYMP